MSAHKPEAVVARQVKAWRKRRGLSAQTLAERVERYGGDLGRQAISKIENGDRRIALDEVLLLAYALAVPPAILIAPVGSDDDVEIVPGVPLHPHLALKWFVGQEPPMRADRSVVGELLEEWHAGVRPMRLYQDLQAAQDSMHTSDSQQLLAEAAGDAVRIQAAKATRVEALQKLAEAVNAVVRDGFAVPAYPQSWVDDLLRFGLLERPEAVKVFQQEGKQDG